MDKPIKIERDEFGLVKNTKYVFKDDGRRVDWRAMIPSEHLVPNRQNFERRGEKVPENVNGLADKDLLILLSGIRFVADLRQFKSVEYTIKSSPEHCTAVCKITWTPNFETENQEKTFSGIGDATLNNTTGFGQKFLGPIAENRAFIRAVRNALQINILGKDEIDGATQEQSKENTTNQEVATMQSKLQKFMDETGVTFENIKQKLIDENIPDANNFNAINDFPKPVLISMISRLQKILNKKKTTKK